MLDFKVSALYPKSSSWPFIATSWLESNDIKPYVVSLLLVIPIVKLPVEAELLEKPILPLVPS